jgi:hypothetical protein
MTATPHPRSAHFFQTVVAPTVGEFLANDQSIRRGFLAAIVLSHMADYWAADDGHSDAHRVRTSVAGACPAFQLVWDVADAAKHQTLTKRTNTRTMTHAGQVRAPAATFGSFVFGEVPFGATGSPVKVSQDDGSTAFLKPAIRASVEEWERRLSAR